MNIMKIFSLLLIVGFCTNIQAMLRSNERKLLNGNISARAYLDNVAQDTTGWGKYAYMMQAIRDADYSQYENNYYEGLIYRLERLTQSVNAERDPERYLRELTKTLISQVYRIITG